LIGMLWVNSVEAEAKIGFVAAFHAGLAELGYVDGKTIRVEERFGDGGYKRTEELAAELVRLNVDLIVTAAEGAHAAARATQAIPIVATVMADPVAEGFAASLAHPGGNLTGSTVFFPQIMTKRLEQLKETLPALARAGVLTPQIEPFARYTVEVMTTTAKPLGVDLRFVEAADAATYERGFAAASAAGIGALVIIDYPLFFPRLLRPGDSRARISTAHRGSAALCARRRPLRIRRALPRALPQRRDLRRQDPERRETRRRSHRTGDEVRDGRQSEDREGVRPRCAADPARRRR
jgi:hypothetical protein